MSFGYSEKTTVIFDVDLGSNQIYFELYEEDEVCTAAFYDKEKAEVNLLRCASEEYSELKKLSHECKVLINPISYKYEYDNKKIYNQIIGKFQKLGNLISEDYDDIDGLGFVKISVYSTTKVIELAKKAEEALKSFLGEEANNINDIDWYSLEDIDWDSIDWDSLSEFDSYSSKSTSKNNSNSSSKSNNGKTKLSVWSFTDEIEGYLDAEGYGYKTNHPNIEVDYTYIPTGQFPSKLGPVLTSGNGTPDVFCLEDFFVREYVESGLLLPLDDLYAQVKDKMVYYPMKIRSYHVHVYAMSWYVSPGAVFYRRSYAKKYWGTDDPVEVQKKLKDFDTFLATARQLKKDSNGKCRIVSTTENLFIPFKGTREKPWIVDDKLYIDPAMEKYMNMAKIFHDEELDGRTSQWAEGWYAGMNDSLKDYKGNNIEVMCYFLPTWGLHYVLKTDDSRTSGDWAMCAGPSSWRWGGCWLAAYKGTKQPEAAKEMIRYIATDDQFLESMALASEDIVGNIIVQDKVKRFFSERFLNGQNHYAAFCDYSKTVDGSLTQGTDQQIEALWSEAVSEYVWGEKTKKEALQAFREQVSITMGY
ncbi:MAG: carbohydrate ABC transporter substrate-binding protein [Treponema sp.]|nr:carbohydrate ABC transporter substrate-binding protein [Treponema sp.]